MSKVYDLRSYKLHDEEKAVPLLEIVYNKWPHFDLRCTSREHYTWKYLDTPYNYKCIVYATDGDEIIGSCHTIVKRVKFFDTIHMSGIGGDAAVHPDYRSIGVFNSVKEIQDTLMKEAGVHLCHSITGNPILIESSKRRASPCIPYDFIHLIRIEDLLKYVEAVRNTGQGVRRLGKNILNRISTLKPATKSVSHEYSTDVTEYDRFEPEYQTFWSMISKHYDFIYERDTSYLNWRYGDHRGGTYIKAHIKKDDSILGFVVLRINKYIEDYPEGYIVDLITMPGREDVLRFLLAYSIRKISEEGANVIHCWAFRDSNLARIASEFSFHQLAKLNIHFRKELVSEKEIKRFNELDLQRIHLSYGDHDWI